jgi:hypothetical protein
MKKTQVFFWVGKVGRGREDPSYEDGPRRPATVGLDEILAYRLERDPHPTTRRLTAFLGILPQTVVGHLQEGLEMKCFRLRCVLDTLIDRQKPTGSVSLKK